MHLIPQILFATDDITTKRDKDRKLPEKLGTDLVVERS